MNVKGERRKAREAQVALAGLKEENAQLKTELEQLKQTRKKAVKKNEQ